MATRSITGPSRSRGIVQRVSGAVRHFRDFVTAPAVPVLQGYRYRFPPLVERAGLLALLGLVGFIGYFYGSTLAIVPPSYLLYLALPIALVGLLIIWVLPSGLSGPTRLLTWLFSGFFFALFLWPNYMAIALPGLPWISLRRLFGFPLLLTLLICVSVSKAFRTEVARALSGYPLLAKLVIAFVIVQILSIGMSSTPAASLNIWINNQVVWTSVFFCAAFVFRTEASVERWAGRMIWTAVALSIIGVFEARAQRILWVDHIPSFLRVADDSVQTTLAGNARDGVYRATTTFSVPLAYGEYLAAIAPFALDRAFRATGVFKTLAWVIADIILLVGVLMSGSRLGAVGYITGHAIFVLIWASRRWARSRGDMIGPALTLAYPALLAIFMVLVMSVDALHNRVLGGGSSQYSNDGRQVQFDMAPSKWLRSPVIGYGPGRSADTLGYANIAGRMSVDSYILTVSLDYGFLGLGLLTAIIVMSGAHLARFAIWDPLMPTISVALASAIGVMAISKTVFSQEDNNSLIYAFAAMSSCLFSIAKSRHAAILKKRESV